MFDPKEIADKATVVIAGFAVVENGKGYSVYDLNDCEGVAIFLPDRQLLECFHAHASDSKLTEEGAAKFFVKENGDTIVAKRGVLKDRELSLIQSFIKDHYQEMYEMWRERSVTGFYNGD